MLWGSPLAAMQASFFFKSGGQVISIHYPKSVTMDRPPGGLLKGLNPQGDGAGWLVAV